MYFILYFFASLWSNWLYGGETARVDKRTIEYISRILQGPACSTPQPFFDLIHLGSSSRREIAWRLSHWSLLPVSRASATRSVRLWQEQHLVKTLQTQLNPPLVYGLKIKFLGTSFGSAPVVKAFQRFSETLRLSTKRGFQSQRNRGSHRYPRIGLQVRTTPHNL